MSEPYNEAQLEVVKKLILNHHAVFNHHSRDKLHTLADVLRKFVENATVDETTSGRAFGQAVTQYHSMQDVVGGKGGVAATIKKVMDTCDKIVELNGKEHEELILAYPDLDELRTEEDMMRRSKMSARGRDLLEERRILNKQSRFWEAALESLQ